MIRDAGSRRAVEETLYSQMIISLHDASIAMVVEDTEEQDPLLREQIMEKSTILYPTSINIKLFTLTDSNLTMGGIPVITAVPPLKVLIDVSAHPPFLHTRFW